MLHKEENLRLLEAYYEILGSDLIKIKISFCVFYVASKLSNKHPLGRLAQPTYYCPSASTL